MYGIDDCQVRSNLSRMRILSKRELRGLVLYSPAHIDRLEKQGLFPKRVRLGPGRVGWIEAEVLEWLRERIVQRDSGAREALEVVRPALKG